MSPPVRCIGIIGDVHAQHLALAAALDFLRSRRVDAILVVGDIVDGDGDVNRCCELLAAPDIVTVRGNHDRWMLRGANLSMPNATHEADLVPASLAFVAGLEPEWSFTTTGGAGLLCHALGRDDMTVLDTGEPVEITRSRRGASELLARYSYVVNGHSHRRGVTHIETTTFINAGTLAPDNDPCFGIVDFGVPDVRFFEFDSNLNISVSKWLSLRPAVAGARAERDTLPPSAPDPIWTVRVFFREPTYEAHRGLPPTEYRKSFAVVADSEDAARDTGLAMFRGYVRLDGVGWARSVVRVEVDPPAAP